MEEMRIYHGELKEAGIKESEEFRFVPQLFCLSQAVSGSCL